MSRQTDMVSGHLQFQPVYQRAFLLGVAANISSEKPFLFCMDTICTDTCMDQANSLLSFLPPSFPPSLVTYLHLTCIYEHHASAESRQRRGMRLLSTQGVLSLYLFTWLCSSQLFYPLIFWPEEVCIHFASTQSFWKETFPEFLSWLLTPALSQWNLFFFFNFYLFSERERQRMNEGWAEREGDRESQAGSVLSDTGLELTGREITT